MNYIEVEVDLIELDPWREILISEFSEIEYESFVETEKGFKAYIQESLFKEDDLQGFKTFSTSETFSISIRHTLIEDQNWNSVWESSFDPIFIDDWCAIRAPFHNPIQTDCEVIIEPKMSFGTGHHQTTFMMVQMMKELDFQNKSILDMGSGTGVLAIIAKHLGGNQILAIDNEEWAYQNCIENLSLNYIDDIEVLLGESERFKGKKFDIVLANINRNALCSMMLDFHEVINENGFLLLSGFLNSDFEFMKKELLKSSLEIVSKKEKENWLSLCCQKQ